MKRLRARYRCTVAHCNDSIAGDFAYTVNATDMATLWGERRAQWNKGQEQTVRSMDKIDALLPFPVREWHPDTGSKFINWHCKKWADNRKQRLTRSRPNHKNDNCFVEERNGHIVRKRILVYAVRGAGSRLCTQRFVRYSPPVPQSFSALRRIISRQRIGAKWKVIREPVSLTPHQRVLRRNDVSARTKAELRRVHARLNPLILKREIDRRLRRVFDVHTRHRKPNV